MLITRIAAKNYKTYLNLDLDLSVEPDKPIVLIGGQNGGGKTTLFQAIYSALYGLEIKDAETFKQIVSAAANFNEDTKIELEIEFEGKVLTQTFKYKLSRIYALNSQKKPVESVTLNFNGDSFTYGSAMPFTQRSKNEAEVNKIIKANLPKELSKYFLFDAMESGNILEKDFLSRVIKENIENVMGFNKYSHLKEATVKLKERYISESLNIESEREEYEKLVKTKEATEKKILDLKEEQQVKLGYTIDKKEMYTKAKQGLNIQKEYQEQIQFLENKIEELKGKQAEYLNTINKFSNDVEIQVFLPKLIDTIREELELILSKNDSSKNYQLTGEQLDLLKEKLSAYTSNERITSFDTDSFITYLIDNLNQEKESNPYNYFSIEELETIRLVLNQSSINNYSFIIQNKESLENELKQLPTLYAQLEDAKSHLTDDDNSIIDSYERNEARLAEIKESVKNLQVDLEKINNQINIYDLPDDDTSNPQLEKCKKLEPIFDRIAAALLNAKKARIEQTMLEDLNTTLVAYAGQIGRVELSENLADLTFKIYHNAGNEIYLEHLNAASKQIIVQVLLKALHQFGDYNPPVMIDTVMGYLDEGSRASLLENYFPRLSHQTILLSTDSEIRTGKDLPKIESFISKMYLLDRDKVQQSTTIKEGYFNA